VAPALGIRVEPDTAGEQLTDDTLRDLATLREPLQHPRDASLDAFPRRLARRAALARPQDSQILSGPSSVLLIILWERITISIKVGGFSGTRISALRVFAKP